MSNAVVMEVRSKREEANEQHALEDHASLDQSPAYLLLRDGEVFVRYARRSSTEEKFTQYVEPDKGRNHSAWMDWSKPRYVVAILGQR